MTDKQTVKVGDKVRCLVTEFDVRKGELYEVREVQDSGRVWFLDDVSGRFYLEVDEYEPLPVADATGKPAFKVGDRVKIGGDHPYILSDSNTTGKIIGGNNGRRGEWEVQLDNYGGSLSFKTDELKRLSSPLTIETGKYYRTRDGRKVGPMSDEGDRAYDTDEKCLAAYINGDHRLFRADGGRHLFGKAHLDLIAEWVDEPLATASTDAASNDNVPVATFKVGDIVKRSGGFMPHQRLRITKAVGDRYSVEWLEGGPGSIDNWRGYELELAGPTSQPAIVALIENGQPKPSEKPKVHKSEVSATDEAERLAVKYPGQKFGVFVLADSRIADVVIRRAA